MLCVWWDWKGIIHYELLPPAKTTNSYLYWQQPMQLKQDVKKKRLELMNRKSIVVHHDINAKPHTSLAIRLILAVRNRPPPRHLSGGGPLPDRAPGSRLSGAGTPSSGRRSITSEPHRLRSAGGALPSRGERVPRPYIYRDTFTAAGDKSRC
ncbi:Mariner Mos1 transposase [Eumeta japonica]|uniref:Mariner Mos1 transposase n=1 Tax=Eumeta variegata TaxID=151549 RepID=A0A4C1XGS3_EUMVA|nr:Mariner Mos1 transposase [Eumeta japonica]